MDMGISERNEYTTRIVSTKHESYIYDAIITIILSNLSGSESICFKKVAQSYTTYREKHAEDWETNAKKWNQKWWKEHEKNQEF